MTLVIDLKVVPNSGKQKFMLDKSDQLKCYLKSVPEKGKANNELIKLLAKKLGISNKDIQIIFGETSRKKRLKIDLDISYEQLLAKLGIENQLRIDL